MKEEEKEEGKREREGEIEEKINREGRYDARANRSCRLYLTLQTGAAGEGLAFLLPSRS